MILVILCLAPCSIAGAANGQQSAGGMQPPPAIFFKLGLTGISADQQNLYVMAGGKILQYEISKMTLLRSVDLPDLPPPANCPPKGTDSENSHPPPPPPMPHGLWVGNGVLYVLAGPVVYTYSIPGLTVQKTVELPKPELPQVGK